MTSFEFSNSVKRNQALALQIENENVRVHGSKMGIAISQVLAFLEPCFHARSSVRMALRRLMKKHSSGDEFNREIVILILPQGYPFYPHRPYTKYNKYERITLSYLFSYFLWNITDTLT